MTASHFIRIAGATLASLSLALSVPSQETPPPAPREKSAASKPTAPTRLDLNTADVKSLAAVPVIGPDVAQTIVAARPFASINELDRLKGLTAEQLEQIRAVVAVATPPAPGKVRSPHPDTLGASNRRADAAKKVDLNTADSRTLESVPGVTPDIARAILAARPFESLDGLSRVKGITAEQLELIRAAVVVTPASVPAP
jgi:DNA uptake protein ComE-like DNA-binding protein